MQQHPTSSEEVLSFIKLHSTLCFLMTRFQQHQCPQLSQFIVRHISLLVEHPDVASLANCQALYLQQLQQWQNITAALLAQKKSLTVDRKSIH